MHPYIEAIFSDFYLSSCSGKISKESVEITGHEQQGIETGTQGVVYPFLQLSVIMQERKMGSWKAATGLHRWFYIESRFFGKSLDLSSQKSPGKRHLNKDSEESVCQACLQIPLQSAEVQKGEGRICSQGLSQENGTQKEKQKTKMGN